jgi:hypothetical protein
LTTTPGSAVSLGFRTEPAVTDVAGVPFDKIGSLANVRHIARMDDSNVLLLVRPGTGPINLTTIALP